MTQPLPLSVFIIAKNEADRIGAAIASVQQMASEVIVIDSGSDDDTVAVAEAAGARVLFNAWQGYGPQKVFGEGQCHNDWVLNIDADEEVSSELAASITALFADGTPDHSAYQLRIKTIFRFETSVPPFAPGKWMVRLYDKSRAGFKDSPVHDSVVVRAGKTSRTRGLLLHRSFRDLAHWADKLNRYSTLQAADIVAKKRRFLGLRIVLEPLLAFCKSYFLRGYICYGIDGIVASRLYAHGRMLRMAKARELLKANNKANDNG